MDDAQPQTKTATTTGQQSPGAAPAPAGKSEERPLTESQRQSNLVRDCVVPGYMQVVIGANAPLDKTAALGYRDELIRDMGSPKDPLERMLIEQVGIAHVMVMRLHGLCATADNAERTALYATAAGRLLAELRRTIVTLRDYRTPPAKPQVTIQQQNIARRQEIAYVTNPDEDRVSMTCRDKIEGDNKQASNEEKHAADGHQIPSPGSRWSSEPLVAGAAHG